MDYPTDLSAGFIQLTLNYRSTGLGDTSRTDHDLFRAANTDNGWVPTALGAIVLQEGNVSQDTITELTTPLGPLFDGIWSGMKTWATTAAQGAVQNIETNAYAIVPTFPSTGSLRGGVTSSGTTTTIGLSYSLSGVSITFKTTTSGPFGSSEDPSWTVKFDGELQINIAVPSVPPYTLVPQVTFLAHNASGSGNFFADLSTFSNEIVGALVGGLLEGVQGALVGGLAVWLPSTLSGGGASPTDQVDKIDMPISVAGLLQPLQELAVALNTLAEQGFVSLGFAIDSTSGGPTTLHFTLSHPIEPAPVVHIAPSPMQSLIHASISVSTAQVPVGGAVVIDGAGFAAGAATPSIQIQWDDTTVGLDVATTTLTVGNTSQSDVQVAVTTGSGKAPPSPPAPVAIPKHGGSTTNSYTATKLTAGTWYALRVREYDFSDAATDYSAWVYQQAISADQARLELVAGRTNPANLPISLATAAVTAQGAFSSTVTLPHDVAAGNYTLIASTSNATASIPLAVVAADQAMIQIIDPKTGMAQPSTAVGGENVTVRGQGFRTGVITLYADSTSGQKLASTSIATVIAGVDHHLAALTTATPAPAPKNALEIGASAVKKVTIGSQPATATVDGRSFTTTFVWPAGLTGSHTVVAHEVVAGGQTIEASLVVVAQAQAQ